MIVRRNLAGSAIAYLIVGSSTGHTVTTASVRRVGIGYSLWHTKSDWQNDKLSHRPWGTPLLGFYRSDDPNILRQHAAWLYDAHVDYALLDWSNDIDTDTRTQRGAPDQLFIENSTSIMFKTWNSLPKRPRVAFLIGIGSSILQPEIQKYGLEAGLNTLSRGRLERKADQIYELYVQRYPSLIEVYLEKPLLVIYIDGPTPYKNKTPNWQDSRFTTRFMSAYLPESGLADPYSLISSAGYWSWEDRGPQSYAVFNDLPEHMTVVASWRGRPGVAGADRLEGATFNKQWDRATQIGPSHILAGTFNEWWLGEQPSAQNSKDIEPSLEFNTLYLDILRERSLKFKHLS